MAWTSGFFDSVNGDRLYNADQMSNIFEGLISDGVYEAVGNKLAVQPNSGMTIQIATGRGWFGRRWVNNDSEYRLTLAQSDVILNRYVAVVIKVDYTDAVRTSVPYLKYSEFATTPVKPTMTRTETVKEYCLAYIYIKAGATAITASDIEDTRQDTNLCGWVTGLIDQITPDTLYEQFTALFDEWFSGLQDLIDENTETMLVNALPVSVVLTLSPSDWTLDSGLYKQNATVTNMNATKSVIVQPASESMTAFSDSEIRCVGQSTNTLSFTAITKPNESIVVNILHMGV